RILSEYQAEYPAILDIATSLSLNKLFGFKRRRPMGRSIARGTELLTAMLIILTALVLPLFAAARQPGDVPGIAYVGFNHPTSGSEPTPFLDAFRDGLRERGWVEGHTIAIEWRWAEGSLERFATLVTDLVRLPVEVLVVPNATTAGIAKQATS